MLRAASTTNQRLGTPKTWKQTGKRYAKQDVGIEIVGLQRRRCVHSILERTKYEHKEMRAGARRHTHLLFALGHHVHDYSSCT